MGAGNSSAYDVPFDLPQQQVISMVDGQATVPQGSSSASGGQRQPLQVGSSKQAQAVRALLSLPRGGLKLSQNGIVTVEVKATVEGSVWLFRPALAELSNSSLGADDPGSEVIWPKLSTDVGGGQSCSRRVAQGDRCLVSFDHASEILPPAARCDKQMERVSDRAFRWPLVLVLLPGVGSTVESPPDGSLLLCCAIQGGSLHIVQQLIAWGGNLRAFVLQELYGIQEAQVGADGSEDVEGENTKNCVVCLTTPKDTALMPCGHFCVCYDCGASIRLTPMRNRCPLCRQDVQDIVKINVDSPVAVAVSSPSFDRDFPTPVGTVANPSAENQSSSNVEGSHVPTAEASHQCSAAKSEDAADIPADKASHETVLEASAASTSAAPQPSAADMRAARLKALDQRSSPTAATVTALIIVDEPKDSGYPATVDRPAAQYDNVAATSEAATASSSTASSALPPVSQEATLPPRCLQRLTREMRQMEQQKAKNLQEHGLEFSLTDPEGNDLRVWTLRLHTSSVDAGSRLGKQLREWNVPAIIFEVWIPDGFPTSPPKVRVMQPTFSAGSFWVHQYGALCLEILTRQGWSPATSLVQLGVALKNMMTHGNGSISNSGAGASTRDREAAWKKADAIESSHQDWADGPLAPARR